MSGCRVMALALVALIAAACKQGEGSNLPFQTIGRQPDVAPVMRNAELPFRYPPALYAQKVQGNVTLRIFIDNAGLIVTDSTHVAETSGFNALDSAAIKGSRELRFDPARTRGAAVPVSILLPVYFRHPDAPPLAGDSLIARPNVDMAIAAKPATASSTPQDTAAKKDSVVMSPMPAKDLTKPAVAPRKPGATAAKKKAPTRRTTTPRRTTTKKGTTTR